MIAGGLLAAGVFAAASVARADEYADVNRLSSKGLWAQALARADGHLAVKPRDPQMRFLRGVILSETGRFSEAEEVFTRLTQDYPELPEPYNNLAVLLAARQQLDQARAALDMALRNDPAYATAHENLGDVLVQLAARSYARAQQIEPSRQRLQAKLALVRQMPSITDKP
jgi:Flp pilus assembly protein TadD